MTVFTVGPVVLEISGRPVDLQLKVSAPTEGTGLPIILLSHGQGYSNHLEDALGDYIAMGAMGGGGMAPGVRRLASVDLAVRHRRGDRYGLTPPSEAAGDS